VSSVLFRWSVKELQTKFTGNCIGFSCCYMASICTTFLVFGTKNVLLPHIFIKVRVNLSLCWPSTGPWGRILYLIKHHVMKDRILSEWQSTWQVFRNLPLCLQDNDAIVPKNRPRQLPLQFSDHPNISYYLTNYMERKIIVVQLVQKISSLYGKRRFISVFTKAYQWALSWAKWISQNSYALTPKDLF